jgi:hypothetical protein
VDRAPSTIRGWIAAGELKCWKGEATGKGNAPTLISLEELKIMVVQSGKAISPGRPPATPERQLEKLELALAELNQKFMLAQVEVGEGIALKKALSLAEDSIRRADEQVRDLRLALEREQACVTALEAELQVLKASYQLPWWKRLLG